MLGPEECVPVYGAPGDGHDNDCDLNVDEELYNSIDDDHDGVVDEVSALVAATKYYYIVLLQEQRVVE